MDAETETLIPTTGGHFSCEPIALAENTIGRKPENGGNHDGFTEGGPMYTLNATGVHGVAQAIPIDTMNHIGRGDKHSMGDFVPGAPSYTLTKGHSHAVAQPIVLMDQGGSVMNVEYDISGTLRRETHGHEPVVMQPIATHDVAGTMLSRNTSGGFSNSIDHAAAGYMALQAMQVRRLTPVECERLQGFPDNYTDIKSKGKPTPDGPRYKALGNSMAVPVMAWIGKRIQEVEAVNAP
jgi:DNA (cytosine-5)-methyltransferase 1